MNNLSRKLTALLLALALSLGLSAPALAAEDSAVPEALAGCKAPAAARELTGAVQLNWAVWIDGEIAASGQEGGPREDPNASHLQALASFGWNPGVFGVGSVSKIYTTAAVMRLAERGKLDLDKPVVTYLPDFKMADPRYKDVTVRMLLNHSSGLMGSSMVSAMLYDDASETAADKLLEVLSAQRLQADPGAYSVYCNDGFTLAQLVVERVSGMKFQDYLRAYILAPAGLRETWFPNELTASKDRSGLVPIYQGEDPSPMPLECLGVVGAGGIYATAADLARFGGALTGETILKKSSLEAMAAPEYARGLWPEEGGPGALAYGLGWDHVAWFPFSQSGIQALVKGGDTQYYHAGLVVLPEHRMAAAVVSSGGVSTYNELAASQLLLAALEARGVKVDQTPLSLPEAAPAPMPKELTDLSGWYGSLYTFKIDVTEDGKLTLHYVNMPEVPDQTFTYSSDGSFRNEGNTAALYLEEGANGQIYLRQRGFSSIPGLGGLPKNEYAAMKLPENSVSPKLQKLWDSRMNEMIAVPMNERYSSQVYAVLGAAIIAAAAEAETETVPGYTGALAIVDENHARYVPQIPGNAGRDGVDLEFRRDERGVLWVYQSNGSVGMDAAGIPDLSAGRDSAVCTIQPDGYARWYKVGDAAGKVMTVDLPENAGFWVYDSQGGVAASSVLGSSRAVKLPPDGLLVFAGDPGAKFTLTFS